VEQVNKIVHVETRITTVLGVMDEEGNVTQLLNVAAANNDHNDPLLIRKLTKDAFVKAYEALHEIREKLKCQPLTQVSQQ
jgi:hypothetical protein